VCGDKEGGDGFLNGVEFGIIHLGSTAKVAPSFGQAV
jgi:hypothetical protein